MGLPPTGPLAAKAPPEQVENMQVQLKATELGWPQEIPGFGTFVDDGRKVAALVSDARFVPLESRNHILLNTEPAWEQFVHEIDGFLAASSDRRTALSFDELTARERDVLELVAQGLSNADISVRLKISGKTVRNHVSIILSKLGAASRAQAVAISRDAGFWSENGSVDKTYSRGAETRHNVGSWCCGTTPPPAYKCQGRGCLLRQRRFGGAKMQAVTTIGLDIAKSVFQVHGPAAEAARRS